MNPLAPGLRRILTKTTTASLTGFAAYQAISGNLTTALGLAVSSTAIGLVPTLTKNASWWGPIQNSFSTPLQELWLTIDDGPVPEQTPYTLDVLAKHNVTASFFVIGKRVQTAPALCLRMANEGHAVENHTFSHPERSFWMAGHKHASLEISACSRAIADATGVTPTLFRAPVGFANLHVHRAAEEHNLAMLGWSASGNDGIAHCPKRVTQKLIRAAQPGVILLLHDSQIPGIRPGNRAQTLDRVLTLLKAQNYTFAAPLQSSAPPSSRPRG